MGVNALFRNTAGGNTGIGANALRANTTGFQNTAVGHSAFFDNTDGTFNTAIDASALTLNTSDGNTACGNVALFNNTGSNISGISGTNSPGGVAVFCNSDGKLGVISLSGRFKEDIKPMGKASEAILEFKPVSFRYKKEIDLTAFRSLDSLLRR